MVSLTGFEKIVRRAEPLAAHTWLQLGGPAEYFAEPRTPDELLALVQRCHQEGLPVRILGSGSNLLVRDDGVPGMVLRLSAQPFGEIKVEGRTVTAGGGARLGRVVTTSFQQGLAGLEVLVGIPGTLGGALHGNAGTHGGDIGQWTVEAQVVTHAGQVCTRHRDDLVFSYRQSSLDDLVILEAKLHLEQDDPNQLAKRLQTLWILRKATQPMWHQSAGCVFKNPRGMFAGELIEQAGLKGTRVGGAVVSDRHANFLIAERPSTASDVLRLIDLIRTQVQDRMGVLLELELEIW